MFHQFENVVPLATASGRPARSFSRLRLSLLGAVGVSALLLGVAQALPPVYEGDCVLDGSTVTCTGDQAADGVDITDLNIGYLNVYDLTSDIAPAEGVGGVVFQPSGSANVDIDLGSYVITTSGETGHGIIVTGGDETDHALLRVVGNVISADASGVTVSADGQAGADITGDITAFGSALTVMSTSGNAEVDVLGNLTSTAGTGLYVDAVGVDVSLTGDVEAAGAAIHVSNGEAAALLSVTGDVLSLGGTGITIDSAGAVTAGIEGDVEAYAGAVTIKTWGGAADVDLTGDITSHAGSGVYVEGLGVDLTLNGDVDALGDAVHTHSWDTGSSTVTITGNVTSHEGRGVVVEDGAGNANVDIDGNIAALGDGLTIAASGMVELEQHGNLTSHEGRGLVVDARNGKADVDFFGTIAAQGDAVTIESTDNSHELSAQYYQVGSITSYEGRGFYLSSDGGSSTSIGGAVSAQLDAVTVEAATGLVGVNVLGAVTSWEGAGIAASSGGGDVYAFAHSITSKSDAVTVTTQSGTATVETEGAIESYAGAGVTVYSADGLAFANVRNVTAKQDAISVSSANNWAVVIAGAVTSYDGKGIAASTQSGTVDVTTQAVTAKLDAVTAWTADGAVQLDTGAVTSYDGKGFTASTLNGNVSIESGSVTSQLDAIAASTANGTVTIDVAGAVTSYGGRGVNATSDNGAVTIDVSGNVTSELDALGAWTANGNVSVEAGHVLSHKGKGVSAVTDNGAVTIVTRSVQSELDAITAYTPNGAINVFADGSVSSSAGAGISAVTENGKIDVNVWGSLSSAGNALTAYTPNGAVSITIEGSVTSDDGHGVNAVSDSGDVYVNIWNSVSSELDALHAEAANGSVSLAAGNVTSKTGSGVYAVSASSNASVTVGDVTSHLDAVYVDSASGFTAVSAETVSSTVGRGVYADAQGGSLVTYLGGVRSELDAVTLAAAQNIELYGSSVQSRTGVGVHATTDNGWISLNTLGVDSLLDAIYAESTGASGDGSVTVDANGIVSSSEGRGIYARSVNGGVDVDANAVTAKLDAVTAAASNGPVSVTVTGAVTSWDGRGVVADTDTGHVTIQTGAVTAKLDAITASTPDGNITVAATGAIESYDGKGIDVETQSGAIDIDGTGVTAKLDAVRAVTAIGAVDIDLTGAVTSWDRAGIFARTNSGAVDITTGSVTSKLGAIDALTLDGNVAVDVRGAVESYDAFGIKAHSNTGHVLIDVSGNVTSKLDAIVASNTGGSSASIDIDVGGNIVSHSGAGITAEAANGSVTVTSRGTLEARLGGIEASTTGSGAGAFIDITQAGKLTAWTGIGIDAYSAGGPVTIVANGGIEADLDAIHAVSEGGDGIGTVTITGSGAITSHKGSGIVATAAREGITIDSTGAIFADVDGISATGTGNTPTSGIVITQTGDITVGKGRGIHAEGVADVEIALDGDISGGTHGIHATSLSGAVEVAVASGSVLSGSSAAGVYLSSYSGATLTNRGDISSAWGNAVEFTGDGAGTVDNYGIISGNLAYGYVAGSFNNLLGSTFNAGTGIDLAGGTLTNAGLLNFSTGDEDTTLEQSYLTGSLIQTATGRFNSDIRFSDNASDQLVVSGTATLGGGLTVRLQDIYGGLEKDFLILTAADGLTLDGITLTNPVIKGTIVAENGTDAILRVDGVSFVPDNVKPQAVPTSAYVEDIFLAGVPEGLQPLLVELMSTPDLEAYEEALDQLNPEQYGQEILNAYNYNLSFSNRLLSCRVADGDNRFKAEGECDWFGVRGSVLDQDETDEQLGFRQTFATLEAGSQRRIDENWRIGGAVGITNSLMQSADGSSMQGTQGQVGAVVKYDADALLLASTLTAGYGVSRSERRVEIGMVDDVLVGDAPMGYLSTRLHGAYTFELGAAYIKPLFNLDLTATHFAGVTETGGETALTIDAGTQYAVTFNPGIEIGGEIVDSSGALIRPFAQVGLEAALTSDLALDARFSNVDPSVGSFVITQPDPEPVAKLSLGADLLTTDGATLRVYYDGAYGATTRKNGVGMKLSGSLD